MAFRSTTSAAFDTATTKTRRTAKATLVDPFEADFFIMKATEFVTFWPYQGASFGSLPNLMTTK